MNNKYLIWLDILGFQNMANEISKGGNEKFEVIIKKCELLENKLSVLEDKYDNNSDWLAIKESLNDIRTLSYQGLDSNNIFREPRAVRQDLINVISNKINSNKINSNKKLIEGDNYGNSDNWILVVESFNKAFLFIKEILDHNSFYPMNNHIPLEIAIGTALFDKWAILDGTSIIIEEDTIKFLKSNIINHYHDWYKLEYKKSIRSTFVVFTEEAFRELEPLEQAICKRIETFYTADLDGILNRAKVYEFNEEIGYANNDIYSRIDSIYVPPKEYEKIEKTLAESRIVFITGTPECGKTYTAIRLLWLYFCKGYKPKLISGDISKGLEGRSESGFIQCEFQPKTITFFDDPFGINEYQRRERLEREIKTILTNIKNVEDAYVIITSREEIFKHFKKKAIINIDTECRIALKKPSYSYKERKDILFKWAIKDDALWLKHENLKMLIVDKLIDDTILPTPFSIRNFVKKSAKLTTMDTIDNLLKEASRSTAVVFAEEIKNMNENKQLFLTILFSHVSECTSVKQLYTQLVNELGYDKKENFDTILNWFKDDKINIKNKKIVFSHPSYAEALKYLLVDNDGFPTPINNEMIHKVLLALIMNKELVASLTITENYTNLTESSQKLLFQAAEDKAMAGSVAFCVSKYFYTLPEETRMLLFELAEKEDALPGVVYGITLFYDQLPEKARKLLFILAKNESVAGDVIEVVAYNFNNSPEEVRKLLFILAEKETTAGYVAASIASNFKNLPPEVRSLLFDLFQKKAALIGVAHGIAENFNELPDDVRLLLFKLAESEKTVQYFIDAVLRNFECLSEECRVLLFDTLSQNNNTALCVSAFLIKNFDESEEYKKFLFKLAEIENVAGHAAFIIAGMFNKLPDECRKLLFLIAENKKTAKYIPRAIAANFNFLPEEYRRLLFTLAEDKSTRVYVLEAVTKHSDKIPCDFRDSLLLKIRNYEVPKKENY